MTNEQGSPSNTPDPNLYNYSALDKPIDEQKKEFWGLCGQYTNCGYCDEQGRVYDSPNIYHSCHNCGGQGHFKPSMDLNNLFQYAVPKEVNGVIFNWDKEEVTVTFMYPDKSSRFGVKTCWGKAEITDGGLEKACALALFHALYPILKEANK